MFNNVIDSLMMPYIMGITPNPKLTVQVNVPINVYKEEDGTAVLELAIPGLTKDDIELTKKNENGINYLVFDRIEKEPTDEEKEAAKKREWLEHKIKNVKHFSFRIPNTHDIDNCKPVVKDGLLTVRIPLAEEAKPVKFAIE